ncbi:hypothetical protein [Ornithinimicrobium humiphilum]|uniref:hypothetical protein n=1 Tax=Ornithinimicrobium humiphilum TaxID=125288 RepID=UPI0031D39EDD
MATIENPLLVAKGLMVVVSADAEPAAVRPLATSNAVVAEASIFLIRPGFGRDKSGA